MRKPLLAASLAVAVAGLTAIPAEVLAAQPAAKTNSSVNRASANSVSGAQIVQTALRYLGVPYSLTGATPQQGFSCIGFVSYVYHLNGIALPGDLGGAMSYAPLVPFSQLQPGDILYFQNTIWTGLSHAAIYIGGGRFVHSEWFGYGGVRISSFNNDPRDGNYWIGKYLGANRPWDGSSLAPIVTNPTGAVSQPSTSVVQQVQGGTPATVTVSSLNVRSGPSKNQTVVQSVPKGSSVTIIGKSGGWDKVQLADGTIGWVVNYGISSSASASVANSTVGNPTAPSKVGAPTTVRRLPQVGIKVSSLNVHSSPSTSAPVITGVVRGQKVQVLSRSNGWMKIRTPTGDVGWVVSSYTTGSRTPQQAISRYSAAKVNRVRLNGPTISSRASSLRIHTSPSVSAAVVGSLSSGQRAQVIGRSGAWIEVRTSTGAVGWVLGTYTSAGGGGGTTPVYSSKRSSAGSRGSMVTVGAKVHASPGLSGRVVGLVAAGTHVTVLGYRGNWTLVRLPSGATGYVYGAYVH